MAKLRSWPPSKDRSLRAWGASSTSSKRLRWGRWQQRDLLLSQSYLEATPSQEISCTDASPPGGGSAILPPSSFVRLRACLRRSLAMGGAVTVLGSWSLRLSKGIMTAEFVFAQWTARPCIAMCAAETCLERRASGPNCPLTKPGHFCAAALDKLRDGQWDFFSISGRECLERLEDDGHLAASHWAPECKTFSTAKRGFPILDHPVVTSRVPPLCGAVKSRGG